MPKRKTAHSDAAAQEQQDQSTGSSNGSNRRSSKRQHQGISGEEPVNGETREYRELTADDHHKYLSAIYQRLISLDDKMLLVDHNTRAQNAKVESIKATVSDMQDTVDYTRASVDDIEVEVNERTASEETCQEILEKIDETLEAVVERFDELDEKIDRMEKEMQGNDWRRIEQNANLQERLDELEEQLNGRLAPQYNIFTRHSRRSSIGFESSGTLAWSSESWTALMLALLYT